MINNKSNGALIDIRTEREKSKDYLFKEIVASANPVNWVEKKQSEWRKFPIFNQGKSGSCVAQTLAKLVGILYWLKNNLYVHFSATHIYQRRANRPLAGMGGIDAFNIAREGVTLEDLVPSQNMSDADMDNTVIPDYKKEVGKIFKIGNFVQPPVADFETVASVIQTTGKAVMVWFYFMIDEWTSEPEVKHENLDLRGTNTARHSVAAVDFSLVNGKKALIIDDSWGTSYGQAGQRVITEDFFKARNFFVAYPMNFAFDEKQATKPKYTFTAPLLFGSTLPEVGELQDIIKYEGLFPSNIESTGYYGSITAEAVMKFQKKYTVADESEIDSLQGKRVGEKTIAKLNELYGA